MRPRNKQERSMRIKSKDFIEKNTLVFKMDCGTAGCKQKRHEEIWNVMKTVMNGTKDLVLNAMKRKMIKVGFKKDFFTNATESIKINVGWKKVFLVSVIEIKVGCKNDVFVSAMKSIKIKIGWQVNVIKIKVGCKMR